MKSARRNKLPPFKTNLKKGDQVVVIAGKDKGQTGKIIKLVPKKNAVLVENVNMVRRHTKPSRDDEGGIKDKEMPIHVSNVMILDTKENKGVRIRKKILDDDRKVRVSSRSGEVLDT